MRKLHFQVNFNKDIKKYSGRKSCKNLTGRERLLSHTGEGLEVYLLPTPLWVDEYFHTKFMMTAATDTL